MNSQSPNNNQDDEATRLGPVNKKTAHVKANAQKNLFTKHLRVEGVIGEGGVGRVYLAYDRVIGRRVAIKEIIHNSSDNSELTKSFIHEAKITGKLEHPGIIPIYKIGNRADKGPYYVMKHIKGITMEEQFRACTETGPEQGFNQRIKLLDSLIDVCEALAYAHSKGVIHRDIKPGNIISGKFGETILIDWGLAQVINDNDNTQFYNIAKHHQQQTLSDLKSTRPVGTPRYMAPEQLSGHASKASDVYSLGVILFRIITGKLPYNGAAESIEEHLSNDKPTPSPSDFTSSAPAELVAICEKATAKSPPQRFTDAHELLNQLNDYRSGRMVNIYNYSKRELINRFFRRNKLLVSMLSLLLAAIITGAGFALHYAYEMKLAKKEAEQALVVITTFAERAQKQANKIGDTMRANIKALYSDLEQTAYKLSQLNQPNTSEEKNTLSNLQSEYPKFESFSIIESKSLSAESSLGWKTDTQEYKAPIIRTEKGRLEIIFRTPIQRGGHIERYLEAKMYPEKVIPALFPIAPVSDSNPRVIWIMRDDGQIIFDENEKYQGSNIFTDSKIKLSPSLISFAQHTNTDDEGVGYYTFYDDNKKFKKVASWDTIQFTQTERWVIIVTYPYSISDVKPGTIPESF